MASALSFHPRPLLFSPPSRLQRPATPPPNPHFLLNKSRSDAFLVRVGPTDFQELVGRTEGFFYTLADAFVSAATDIDAATVEGSKKNGDWFSGITGYMETVLKVLKGGLSALNVPYSYGFAIILLTVLVKAATFPLTKKQVESAIAMRSLQPQVKAIQERYAGDQERIQLETARLYKLAGVNPLAGCLPTLVTIPVWIGLYRALSNVADEGLLTEGFFWIPSLSGPTTIAARQNGSGTSWLFPFVDGHPPLGWPDTLAYLVLPVALVISQYIAAQIMQPPQTNDPSQNSSQIVTKLLPLMIGYFALSVPSGLSLYWLTNNILSTAQQIWLQKLGGVKNPAKNFSDTTFKDEPSITKKSSSNVQKFVLEVETGKINSSQEVKADSGGLRPGERFKQLKEQEARRRKQKEEDKRRAEDEEKRRVEAGTSSTINEQQSSEIKFVQVTDKKDSDNNGRAPDLPRIHNGSHDLETTQTSPTVNGEEVSCEKLQKDQASEMNVSGGTQTSEWDTSNRRDQKLKKYDN